MLLLLPLAASPGLAQTPVADPYAPGREIVADIGKIVTPNGVQETFEVVLGGARQVVNVRGSDRNNPVLVFAHGGPGSVEMPIAWTFQRPWEDFFTVVQYDQRGAGRSYPLNNPQTLAPTLTPERYRDDAIELIEQLRIKYGKQRVFLLGHSWGSTIGIAVAAKRPDLLYAYIGTGQLIDVKENERMGMAWTLQQARTRSDAQAVRDVQSLRPYPEAGIFSIAQADGWRKHAFGYGAFAAGRKDGNFYLRAPRLSPEYTAEDRKAWSGGGLYTVTTIWPRIKDLSFRKVDRLEVPVIMLLGRRDYMTPSPIAANWMQKLRAPAKVTLWFENSAHIPFVEEPGRFLAALLQHARPLAAQPRTPRLAPSPKQR